MFVPRPEPYYPASACLQYPVDSICQCQCQWACCLSVNEYLGVEEQCLQEAHPINKEQGSVGVAGRWLVGKALEAQMEEQEFGSLGLT